MNRVTVKYYSQEMDAVETQEFEEVVGHQIGNGSIQIIMPDGVIKIIANIIEVDIVPDDNAKERFLAQSKMAYSVPEKKEEVPEATEPKLEVVE